MPDTNENETVTVEDSAAESSAADTEQEHPGASALGDPGKRALDAMKAERNTARAELSELRKEFDALRAQIDGKEAEHAAAVEAQRVKDEALASANERIRKAEVRAAAAGKLADPMDALKFLDLSTIEVGEDGEVDADAVNAALDQLISEKPYLAAQGRRFQGSADAGARNEAVGPKQLTRSELATMTPDQINAAREAGQLADLMSGKSN